MASSEKACPAEAAGEGRVSQKLLEHRIVVRGSPNSTSSDLDFRLRGSTWTFSLAFAVCPLPLDLRITESAKGTLRISLRLSKAAGVHHPDVAQGEVVADRVQGIDVAERGSDLRRHPPARTRISRQPQAAPEPDDMCIQR